MSLDDLLSIVEVKQSLIFVGPYFSFNFRTSFTSIIVILNLKNYVTSKYIYLRRFLRQVEGCVITEQKVPLGFSVKV